MSEDSKKGPLIKKKTKPMDRAKPVIVSSKNDFKFSSSDKSIESKSEVQKEPEVNQKVKSENITTANEEPTKLTKRKGVVGKNNNVKSIKVPHDLHVQIGILGKFMDENKTYAIISELVDYYKKNELTERQKKQIEYMTEFLNEN
ncbi:hypothetical protein [Planococcus halocryophilus]|uniref:hypothetical protein n=1 Tax=Planococcus halocryophilus TaxID=1215089 RepID=UPI001F0EA96C|nr:hypothetical protein [Planococcus halocryophilus]MCH4827540.1 hypothetical protein [Planococcus halocryophilus]